MKLWKLKTLVTVSMLFSLIACEEKHVEDVEPEPVETASSTTEQPKEKAVAKSVTAGNLEFSPATQYKKAEIGTKEVEFVYTAVNTGSEPITITNVDSGCACIEESVDPKVIPPGESARISAIYSTEKLSGLAEKIIAISTDQPNIRDAFLTVKLEMDPIYTIDNSLTTWKKGKKAETRIVNFEVVRDKPIHVLSAKPSRSEITAKVEEIEKGKKYRIHLTPSSTGSNMLGMVRLTTDCEIDAHARPLLYVTVN